MTSIEGTLGLIEVHLTKKDLSIKSFLGAISALSIEIASYFYRGDFSLTRGFQRNSITKRKKSLELIKMNPQNYNANFTVELYRSVLFVNGLEHPVILYSRKKKKEKKKE